MTQKITLNVESSVIKRARKYAEKAGKSLSEIVEDYLENLVEKNEKTLKAINLKKLIGVAKLPKDFNEEKELREYFETKHL